jgi:hypothetical protein
LKIRSRPHLRILQRKTRCAEHCTAKDNSEQFVPGEYREQPASSYHLACYRKVRDATWKR